jgi:DNA-binding transcriptional LysR family regulator
MVPDLPSPLLRSFVAVVDCGSLAAAAARVGRSESALSLQMSRLEDIVGQALFDRDGRALKINQSGSLLLAHSRAILGRIDAARAELGPSAILPARIGIVQDFVAPVLRPTLAKLRTGDPKVSFEIVIGSTAELLQALGEDRIDTALCASDLLGSGPVVTFPMAWFGQADPLDEEVLPLVSITPPCPFLAAAQHALDAGGRPWRIAVITPSLDGLRAAVAAGLGVGCRTIAGIGLPPLNDRRLPLLPEIRYTVVERRHGKDGPGPVAAQMLAHLAPLAAKA